MRHRFRFCSCLCLILSICFMLVVNVAHAGTPDTPTADQNVNIIESHNAIDQRAADQDHAVDFYRPISQTSTIALVHKNIDQQRDTTTAFRPGDGITTRTPNGYDSPMRQFYASHGSASCLNRC